jgi:aerobic C4-dicarboxylate transport protein
MLIAPIIFCTVVHGIARMADMARVGRVAIKALIYFEVLTSIALVIGLVAANLWQPGVGMNVDLSRIDTSAVSTYVAQTRKQDTATFLINIIPNTFVGAFSDGNVLQVLFIAVLCGFALTWIGPRAQPFLDLLEIVSNMLFNVVALVMWAAPASAAPGPFSSAGISRATTACGVSASKAVRLSSASSCGGAIAVT